MAIWNAQSDCITDLEALENPNNEPKQDNFARKNNDLSTFLDNCKDSNHKIRLTNLRTHDHKIRYVRIKHWNDLMKLRMISKFEKQILWFEKEQKTEIPKKVKYANERIYWATQTYLGKPFH